MFKKTEVKFVKITCTKTGKGWASIREILAKGEGVGPLFSNKFKK